MWTRGRLRRTHMAAPVPHVLVDGRKGQMITGGALGLRLPPLVIAMDPSDPKTWTRPVRWTS